MPATPSHLSEERILLLLAGITGVNILDFMLVMPLGPDFAQHLHIPTHHLGWIAGSYTIAAAFSNLSAAFWLDRYDRKQMILRMLSGLIVATILCAGAWSFASLMVARLLAGAFGGPLAALTMAYLADVIPNVRRGTAMGKVSGAFSVASVLGIPFALELSARFSWHAPFLVLSGVMILMWGCAWRWLPAHTNPLQQHNRSRILAHLLVTLRTPMAAPAWAAVSIGIVGAFVIVPNLATHLQYNLGYPREQLGMLYMIGGICSFIGMGLAGRGVDRFGGARITMLTTLLYALILWDGFLTATPPHLPVMLLFTGFMLATTARNVSANTVSSKIPSDTQRASYMAIQASLVHTATSIAAFVGSLLLHETPEGRLAGMPAISTIALLATCCVPVLLWHIERPRLTSIAADVMPSPAHKSTA